MIAPLKLRDFLVERPAPKGIDVVCKLQHFAIITYAVDPARFRELIPPRFALLEIELEGRPAALISVVPFVDVDFTSAVFPFPKFRMGQTNYRVYVTDSLTGERCVWFLGTTLDSWALLVPRRIWNLPWHSGRVAFDCEYDAEARRYKKYRMRTDAAWAPAAVELRQEPDADLLFPGFPNTETGLVCLTHPLAGFYWRRDGKLGSYCVWHERLMVQPATLTHARFELLSRAGLVTEVEQQRPYSVLVEPINEFTIYLPPQIVAAAAVFSEIRS